MAFKNHISDKTPWQRMIKANDHNVDMQKINEDFLNTVKTELNALWLGFGIRAIKPLTGDTKLFRYPVQQYPTKASSISFDKTLDISGTALGIKVQYLIFDTGVINLPKITG